MKQTSLAEWSLRRVIPVLTAVLIVVSAVPSQAVDLYGCDGGPIRVGITNAGVMYHDGRGADVDVFEWFTDETGCVFDLIPVSRSNVFNMVQRGEIDVVPSSGRISARERYAWFVPYAFVHFVVLANAERVPEILDFSELDDIDGLTVGRAQGAGYDRFFDFRFDDLQSKGRIKIYDSYDAAVVGLMDGEIDATVSVPAIYRMHISDMEQDQRFRILDLSPSDPLPVSILFSKGRFSAAHTANWLRLMERLQLSGKFLEILERYLPPEEAAAMVLARPVDQSAYK